MNKQEEGVLKNKKDQSHLTLPFLTDLLGGLPDPPPEGVWIGGIL